MCGITGILNFDRKPVSSTSLKIMTDVIEHRGPDGEGFFIDKSIGLGHRRLAIIDLSPLGNQPMITTNGRYAIVYNGEVYNFMNLRLLLQSKGYEFVSMTDTEVVLNSYIEWGEACLNKFNGFFAFAIWDSQEEELFLARDRYGIKPIYYSYDHKSFVFGSEIKSILKSPSFEKGLDKSGLIEYFTFQNIFSNRTLFNNVNLLPAGSSLLIDFREQKVNSPKKYWDFNFYEPDLVKDEREYIEELDRLIQQAVTRQLISDVEIGAYLSGGMDSGTITALAATQLPNIKSFTCGFDLHSASGIEMGFDEREKAEMMSHLFKTEHYEIVLKAGDMERCMKQLAWHIEEPRLGQSYPNYYISRLASKFVKVVLSGGGGDELFGGYPWRYYRTVNSTDFNDYIKNYYSYWQRLIPQDAMSGIFKPIWNEVKNVDTLDIFKSVFSNNYLNPKKIEDYINASLYFEIKTFLHGLFIIEDKLSMANSLETRVPFLDNDLVEFAMRLPVSLKISNLSSVINFNENEPGNKPGKYFEKTRDGKLALRKVMSRYIPEEITSATKQGFSAPDASWFKGESIEYVKKAILNSNAPIYEFMDYENISKLVKKHLEGEKNYRLLIWSLLSFKSFLDVFFN